MLAKIPLRQVAAFLDDELDSKPLNLKFIGAGMFSQAFAYDTEGDESNESFVIRINSGRVDFDKDRYAYTHFAAPHLPIPPIIRSGRFGGQAFFAISPRILGRTLEDVTHLPDTTLRNLFQTMCAIHQTDISHTAGWGLLNGKGQAADASWLAHLRAFHNHKFPFTWAELLNETCLQEHHLQEFMGHFEAHLPFCAAERSLLHGDFGFSNVLVDGETVTAVLDWAESRYGDFIYDVAYLDYYSSHIPYGRVFKQFYDEQQIDIPYFAERLRCYKLFHGIGGLAIEAILDDEEGYQRELDRLQAVIL